MAEAYFLYLWWWVREWILGLIQKLQVGGGLVQYSNQGQIDSTCLRFRDLFSYCRHTHVTCLWTRTHTHTLAHLHSQIPHADCLTLAPLFWRSTSVYPRACKTKGRLLFYTTSMCKQRVLLLEGKLKTLNWTCKGGLMGAYGPGTCGREAHARDQSSYPNILTEWQMLISDQV